MYVVSIPDIEAELRALGVSEAEFLDRAGIHKRTWERLRAGEYAPRQDTARRIIAAMKVLRAVHSGKPSPGGGDDEGGEMDCAPAGVCP